MWRGRFWKESWNSVRRELRPHIAEKFPYIQGVCQAAPAPTPPILSLRHQRFRIFKHRVPVSFNYQLLLFEGSWYHLILISINCGSNKSNRWSVYWKKILYTKDWWTQCYVLESSVELHPWIACNALRGAPCSIDGGSLISSEALSAGASGACAAGYGPSACSLEEFQDFRVRSPLESLKHTFSAQHKPPMAILPTILAALIEKASPASLLHLCCLFWSLRCWRCCRAERATSWHSRPPISWSKMWPRPCWRPQRRSLPQVPGYLRMFWEVCGRSMMLASAIWWAC